MTLVCNIASSGLVRSNTDDRIRISLSPAELQLLRRALERALFIDTPMIAQGEIAAFSQRALKALPDPLVWARERDEVLAPRGEKCAPSRSA